MKKRGILSLFVLGFSLQSVFGQINQKINNISSLEATDKIIVTVIPSDQNELEITGELADKVEAIFSDNALRLKMKTGYNLQGAQASVVVYSPRITKVIARKGAEVNFEQDMQKSVRMNFTANEGAKIRAKIESGQVDVLTSNGGVIDLIGFTEELTVNNYTGGSFYGKDLNAQRAQVSVNAGGRSEVFVKESADLKVRAGGIIEVYGNPKQHSQKTFVGGKINFH